MIKLIILIILLFPADINAKNRIRVNLDRCVDGDTAKIVLDNKVHTARFLAIDTPETKHPTKKEEFMGKEASNYTCESLTNAYKIEIEYDKNSPKTDKYDRMLVWVYVDNSLLQEKLVEKGYAKVAYLYNKYDYTPKLQELEKKAQEQQIGIWSNVEVKNENKSLDFIYIIVVAFISFISIFINKKQKKRIKKALNTFK